MEVIELREQAALCISFAPEFLKETPQRDVYSAILLNQAEDDIEEQPCLERFQFLAEIHDELDQLMTATIGKITYYEGQECQVDFMTEGDYPTNMACHRVSASWDQGHLILVWTIRLITAAHC